MEAQAAARARSEHLKTAARQTTADAKERKRLYPEARKAEAASMTSGVQTRVAELDSVLNAGVRQRPLVTFPSLKRAPSYPPFDAGGLDRPLPGPRWEQFAPPPPSGLGRLLGGAARYEREETAARAAFEAEQQRHAMADAERRRKLAGLRAAYDQGAAEALGATQNHNASVDQFERDFLAREPEAVAEFCTLVLDSSIYPEGFAHRTRVLYRPEPNGVKLVLRRCKIVCVARPGQQVVAGDRLADRVGIGVLATVFPPELVDRVVGEAGVREQRKRTLPSRVVVYYLLAMVLFFQSGYGEVWNKLVAGLAWARRFRERLELGMQPSPAAITYARQRLGWQVMERLLEETAGPLAGPEQPSAFVAGMRLVAIDGMCLDLPDNEENGTEFGYPSNEGGRGPFPQIRVVGLGECGTRSVLGAATSGLATGEQPLTRQLLGKLAPGDLLLADRNFLSHGLLKDVLATGVHVLWRAKSDVDLPVLEVLADGTWLSRIADPAASRRMRRNGADPKDIPGITVRVIEYTVTSEDGTETSETFTLVTDIPGPARLTPQQAAAAYVSRWQLETCFDELETSLRGGATVVLRSKSPPMIRQEIYAMLCCYQAIRTLISHAADDAGIDPARISFTRARDGIRSRISDSGSFSP
jgi:hypothetical protein